MTIGFRRVLWFEFQQNTVQDWVKKPCNPLLNSAHSIPDLLQEGGVNLQQTAWHLVKGHDSHLFNLIHRNQRKKFSSMDHHSIEGTLHTYTVVSSLEHTPREIKKEKFLDGPCYTNTNQLHF